MTTNIAPEHVDHDIAEIHQNPIRGRGALNAEGRDTLAGKHAVDVVGDGPDLPLGFTGAQDQIIGDGGQLGDREDQDVVRFLLDGRPGDGKGFRL
jgi:hypothetical protein